MEIRENIPLAPLTTLGVGGPARFLLACVSDEDVPNALAFASDRSLPVFILGGGSNLVVSDQGFDGVVISIEPKGIASTELGGGVVRLTAAAGENWDRLVGLAVESNLSGIECMSGIPGWVGGTPVQNVGAYGQEVSETISLVRCFDTVERRFADLANEDCGFSYRQSIFNSAMRGRYIVWYVSYDLQAKGTPKIAYREIEERFAGKTPSLHDMRNAVLEVRRAKSMVIDRSDPNSRSAGSFFKNPIVSQSMFDDLRQRFGSEIQGFRTAEGVKVPAAWLIERAGIARGFSIGNAGISANHSLAIINRGGATASEIIDIKETVQERVRKKFGIDLVPEPVFLGFD